MRTTNKMEETKVEMVTLTFLRKVGGRKKYIFRSKYEALMYAGEWGWLVQGDFE